MMLATIRHQDSGMLVVAAKCLTGYLKTSKSISDADSFVKLHGEFDAEFVAFVVSWQGKHGCTADGVIGPDTWKMIAKNAPTCSTGKNRISGYTFALQLILGNSVKADAIYGTRTKAAVATAQDASGLGVDGICGPKTWNALIVGAEPKPEPTPGHFVQPVDYKQAAKPWGPRMYSNHNDPGQTMANSGCGPTAMADVIATLVDPNVNPYDLAQLAVKWGDRSDNSGTNWSFFPHIAEYYSFEKYVKSTNLNVLKACLDAGGYVVCSMGPGYWTKGGHYICAWKYDTKYIYCNDPASSKRTKQSISDFVKERKMYFAFYPNKTTQEPVNEPTEAKDVNELPSVGVLQGDKICDVSKNQGTIDWDKLAPEIAFVVIKASGLYRNGTDPQYVRNVREAVKHNIPFHAYHFLYSKTEEEAKRDAKLFYDSVVSGGSRPLYWVLDCETEWGVKDADAPKIARAFEDELRRLAEPGIKVAIYVANEKYADWKFDYKRFAYVWIPKYTKEPPTYPCDLWQYTSTGTLPGISGRVDLDRLMGTKPMWFFTGEEPVEYGTDEPTKAPEAYVEVTGSSVNVRTNPGTEGTKIIRAVKQGTMLPYKATTTVNGSEWHEVEIDGKDGWISGKYSRLVE